MLPRPNARAVAPIVLVSVLVAVGCGTSKPRTQSVPAGPPAIESPLCELPAGLEPVLTTQPGPIIGGSEKTGIGGVIQTWIYVASEDARRAAIVASRGTRQLVVLGCVPGPEHDEIKGLAMSADGLHVAYAARDGQRWSVSRDGKLGEAWDDVYLPTFSADGRQLSYRARRAGQWHQVVDGTTGPGLEDTFVAAFLKNGFAYLGKRRGKWAIMPSSPDGPEWDAVAHQTVTPDRRRLAFAGRSGVEPWQIVDGTRRGPLFKELTRPVFSPDGAHVAYRAQGVADARYDSRLDPEAGPIQERATLAPSGMMPVWLMVVDHQVRAANLILAGPKFSADGSLLAYASGSNFYSVIYLNHERAAVLKAEGKGQFFLNDLGISPTGRQLWVAVTQKGVMPFTGHRLLRRYDIRVDTTTNKRTLVNPRDEPRIWWEAYFWNPIFSADGRRLSYAVRDRGYAPYVVLDGQPGASYDEVMPDRLHFAGSSLVYVARRGRTLLRVTQP